MTRTRLLLFLCCLAGAGVLHAQQTVAAHVSTLLNCLRQPDGGRIAAPCLRLVPAADRDAVFDGLLAACRRERDDRLYLQLRDAAVRAPECGISMLDDVLERATAALPATNWVAYDDGWVCDYLDAVLPHASPEQVTMVLGYFTGRQWIHLPTFATDLAGRRRLACRFVYALRDAELRSKTPEQLADRLYRLATERGLAIFACRLVAGQPRFASIAERLRAAYADNESDLGAAVSTHLDRIAPGEQVEWLQWPDDAPVAHAWLLARAFPSARQARWGHVMTLVGDDKAARAIAFERVFASPPVSSDWLLIAKIAGLIDVGDTTTQRAFGEWLATFDDPDRLRWLLHGVFRQWPEATRRQCLDGLGRWRSPVMESCQLANEGMDCRLAIGPDLAVEFVAERLQRLAVELRTTPATPLPAEQVQARWATVFGGWRDLCSPGLSSAAIGARLDAHLRTPAAADEALVPRLCHLVQELDGGDSTTARALVLALVQGPPRGESLAVPAVPVWPQSAIADHGRVVVVGEPKAWTALAEFARDLPLSFQATAPYGTREPDWAIAAKMAARQGVRWLSADECRSLNSLWSTSGLLTRTRVDGKPLFAPAAAESVVESGIPLTRCRLRAAQ